MASYEDGLREGRRLAEAEAAESLDRAWRRLVEFPLPTCCRHWAAAVVMDAMDRLGCAPPAHVIAAVIEADDETALAWERV